MKYIQKHSTPPELVAYRQTPGASYPKMRKKKVYIRKSNCRLQKNKDISAAIVGGESVVIQTHKSSISLQRELLFMKKCSLIMKPIYWHVATGAKKNELCRPLENRICIVNR